ncbi:MAG TPA: hypothetical protein VFR24_08315 [Candidatus Angelobacter sp.]|nr:hypothetical protein [Candidatus Angelobacter sp.]
MELLHINAICPEKSKLSNMDVLRLLQTEDYRPGQWAMSLRHSIEEPAGNTIHINPEEARASDLFHPTFEKYAL